MKGRLSEARAVELRIMFDIVQVSVLCLTKKGERRREHGQIQA